MTYREIIFPKTKINYRVYIRINAMNTLFTALKWESNTKLHLGWLNLVIQEQKSVFNGEQPPTPSPNKCLKPPSKNTRDKLIS